MRTYPNRCRIHALALLLSLLVPLSALPQPTAFTYQGRLSSGSGNASGSYDLRFTVYDSANNGNIVGGPLTNSATAVSNGLFAVQLDFGAGIFNGSARWIEIGARTNGNGTFAVLSPRQPVTSTPYAIQAANVSGPVSLAQLPAAVVTNGASGVSISGSFSGSGTALTNIPVGSINSYGAFTLITNGFGFALASAPQGNFPECIAIADVNGDGKSDLIAGSGFNSVVTVLTNSGSGGFNTSASLGVGSEVRSIAVADINGDGSPDIIAASQYSYGLTVLTNNGAGVFTLYATVSIGAQPYAVAAADVNGDGKLDLICVNQSSPGVTVLINNGNGTFLPLNYSTGTGSAPYSVAVADVNGDGKPDIIYADELKNSVTILLNSGAGTFASNSTYSVGSEPYCVIAADVNGDGKLDLITANYGSASLTVLTNNGSGAFALSATLNAGNNPAGVVAADVNGDGKTDLACVNANDGSMMVYLNNGSGGFNVGGLLTVDSYPIALAAGDINHDGRIDLVSANLYGSTCSVYTNVAGAATVELSPSGQGGGIRLSASANDSPDTIAGAAVNTVDFGISGAVIAGGGSTNFLGQYSANHISANYAAIGGGSGNWVAQGADHSLIDGGWNNLIGPGAYQSVIGGGWYNTNLALSSVIAGGNGNLILPGANASFIGGGGAGTIGTNSNNSVIAGGVYNSIQNNDYEATIAGGWTNTIEGNNEQSAIGGGEANDIQFGAIVSTISGGYANVVESNAETAYIGGGWGNSNGGYISAVVGGQSNVVQQLADHSTIGGGFGNVIIGSAVLNTYHFIGGGFGNAILTNTECATIGGGASNTVSGSSATIPGGTNNFASGYSSLAAGNNAQATNDGTFVWSDNEGTPFGSTTTNQFNVRANGGVRFVTGGVGMTLDGQAVFAGVNGGTLTNLSAQQLSGGIPLAQIPVAVVTNNNSTSVTLTGSFNGSGGGLTNVWQTGGNSGTSPSANYLGTADNQALELHVDGVRALRLEPGASGTVPNVIGGYSGNLEDNSSQGVAIGGGGTSGFVNHASASLTTIAGGSGNVIAGGANDSTVGGGRQNTIDTNSWGAVISGGHGNWIQSGNSPGGSLGNSSYSAISGGYGNVIGSNVINATISGGGANTNSGSYAVIPGGYENLASGQYSFAAGEHAQATNQGAFVWADSQGTAFSSDSNNVFLVRAGGGVGINTNNPNGSSLDVTGSRIGGWKTSIGAFENYSTAQSNSPALRVLVDGGNPMDGALSVSANISSTTAGLIAEFGNTGSFVVVITNDGTIYSKGVALTSDRNTKENFTALDARAVLERIAAMPVTEWNYKEDGASRKHIGPVAQDFHAAFGLNGTDDRHISVVDESGVALAAIQGLNEKMEQQNSELREKEAQIADLKRQNDTFAGQLKQLKDTVNALQKGLTYQGPVTR